MRGVTVLFLANFDTSEVVDLCFKCPGSAPCPRDLLSSEEEQSKGFVMVCLGLGCWREPGIQEFRV